MVGSPQQQGSRDIENRVGFLFIGRGIGVLREVLPDRHLADRVVDVEVKPINRANEGLRNGVQPVPVSRASAKLQR